MTKMIDETKSNLIKLFSEYLSDNERDALKYQLSISTLNILKKNNGITWDNQPVNLSSILNSLIQIQPYRDRVPEYGLAYKGFTTFITDKLLEELVYESEQFRTLSRPNLDQYIYQVETPDNSTVAEILANSKELHDFVCYYAGPTLKSFVTSYLYYDKPGQCSRPHVDNAFTSITVMVGLKQELKHGCISKLSSSFIYWPNKPPLEYQLKPGEIAIFFGSCVLHGRSKLEDGEYTSALLMSFRPTSESQHEYRTA